MKFSRSFGMILVCSVVSGCSFHTATYGTGESVEAGLAKDLAGLVSFGTLGTSKDKPQISYRERAALVVPSEEQFAAIPAPIDKVDEVDDNFPGRAAEIERAELKKEGKKKAVNVNSIIGTAQAQPLGLLKKNEKEQKLSALNDAESKDNNISPRITSGSVPAGATLAKSPETIAKERGVTVEELPEALQGGLIRERSILERAGLVEPKRVVRGRPALTEVPVEYRTVEGTRSDPEVEQLLSGKKKKKKKRFLLF